MQIQIASDLHCEHYQDYEHELLLKFPIPENSHEISLVLAGDIFQTSAFSDEELYRLFWFFCSKYLDVYYLPGNHEYYGSTPLLTNTKILRIVKKFKNLRYLYGKAIFENTNNRIIGHTLWFPQALDYLLYKHGMNDFNLIKELVPWVFSENVNFVRFLYKHLKEDDIVITHHLPSSRSVPKLFKNSPLNIFFMTELETLILERKPKLWIHGHSHVPVDYMLGQTRIISNPYGYPSENKHKKSFRQGIIEI